jgi:uncharacterized protein with GYD domain
MQRRRGAGPWLPEDHLARFVIEAVEELDLEAFAKGKQWVAGRSNRSRQEKIGRRGSAARRSPVGGSSNVRWYGPRAAGSVGGVPSKETEMPKYLVQNSYTAEGMQGLMAEGGSSRREASAALIESLGGKLESFYYSFGGSDVVLIADLPDNASVVAAVATVASSGALGGAKTTVLITPEEVDKASEKAASYRAPK